MDRTLEVLRLFSIAQEIAFSMSSDVGCDDHTSEEIFFNACEIASSIVAEENTTPVLETSPVSTKLGVAEVNRDFVAFSMSEIDHYSMVAGDGRELTEMMPEARVYSWEGQRPEETNNLEDSSDDSKES